MKETLIDLIPPKECRNCMYFVRVSGTTQTVSKQGFCRLGQKNNDYGLYVSASISRNCGSYRLDEDKEKVRQLEEKLHKKRCDQQRDVFAPRRDLERYRDYILALTRSFQIFKEENSAELAFLYNACEMSIDEYDMIFRELRSLTNRLIYLFTEDGKQDEVYDFITSSR